MSTLKPHTDDWRRHEAGTLYEGWIKSYEMGTGDYGAYVRLFLKGDKIDYDASLMASATLSPKSKLGGWVSLLYPDYSFKDEFDLDMLIGMPVMVMFEHAKRDDGGWSETGKIVARGKGEPRADLDETAPF